MEVDGRWQSYGLLGFLKMCALRWLTHTPTCVWNLKRSISPFYRFLAWRLSCTSSPKSIISSWLHASNLKSKSQSRNVHITSHACKNTKHFTLLHTSVTFVCFVCGQPVSHLNHKIDLLFVSVFMLTPYNHNSANTLKSAWFLRFNSTLHRLTRIWHIVFNSASLDLTCSTVR